MTTISFDRIDHVAAGVRDLDLTVAWWSEHFGFEREVDFEVRETGARGAFIRRGDIRIEFFQYPDPLPLSAEQRDFGAALREGGFHHIALQVDNVEAAVAELERRGVEVAFPLPGRTLNVARDHVRLVRDQRNHHPASLSRERLRCRTNGRFSQNRVVRRADAKRERQRRRNEGRTPPASYSP